MCTTGEIPSCFKRINRKAIKHHRCYECGSVIDPGETYSLASGVWDGTGKSFKQCSVCTRLFEEASEEAYEDEGPCFGELWDYIAGQE